MYAPILNEKDLPLEDFRKIGLVKGDELMLERKDIHALLSGGMTSLLKLHDVSHEDFVIKEIEVKLSLARNSSLKPAMLIHPVYREPNRPHNLTQAEADQLITGERASISKEIEVLDEKRSALVEFDWDTKEFIVTDISSIQAPEKVNGMALSPYQKERYRAGRQIELEDGTTVQASGTTPEGIRSNRLALVVSLLMDGGISYLILTGIKAMVGDRGLLPQTDERNSNYQKALEEATQQSTPKSKTENAATTTNANEYSRGYGRSGISR